MKTSARIIRRAVVVVAGGLMMAVLPAVLTRTAFTQQQSGTFVLNPSTVSGGGGTSVNGSTRLDGTVGQPLVGSSINDTLAIDSGFWTPTATLPISYYIADLDGDGKSDLGFYRAGLWGFLKSSQNYNTANAQFFSWGSAGLQPIFADFDSDGRADPGIWRETQAVWIVPKSSTSYTQFVYSQWGQFADIPQPNSVGKR